MKSIEDELHTYIEADRYQRSAIKDLRIGAGLICSENIFSMFLGSTSPEYLVVGIGIEVAGAVLTMRGLVKGVRSHVYNREIARGVLENAENQMSKGEQ